MSKCKNTVIYRVLNIPNCTKRDKQHPKSPKSDTEVLTPFTLFCVAENEQVEKKGAPRRAEINDLLRQIAH